MTRQLPVRIGYGVPGRAGKHQVPTSAPLRVGYGAFAFQERIHLSERCNTQTLYQSYAGGATPLWIPCFTSPVGDVDSPHRKLSQRHTRLSAARRRHLRKWPTMTLSSLWSAKCSGLSEGNGCIECVLANRRIRVYGRWVRTYAVNRPSSPCRRCNLIKNVV